MYTPYWACSTVDSGYNKLLGPSEITVFVISKKIYIRDAKTIKYKEILNFGTKKKNFVIQWNLFITRSLGS